LGDIIGFVLEEQNFERMTFNVTSKKENQIPQINSTRRTIATSKSVPAFPMEYRTEIKENENNNNTINGTRKRKNKSIIITNRNSSKPENEREMTSSNITNMKTVSRGRSTEKKE